MFSHKDTKPQRIFILSVREAMGVGHKPEPAEATAFRPQILVDDFSVYADTVLDGFTEFVNEQPGWSLTPDNHEGVHVTAENGWILVQTVF